MKWFVPGDIDGFFGLALDNLIQVLLIIALCGGLLGFPPELLYGKLLPGVAVSLLVGNLFYARQAMLLARATGRTDVCALPYGINTPSVFIYVFLVMLPVKLAALGKGLSEEDAARLAWQAGLAACLGSGLIEFAGAWVAERIRRSTPRAALLSTLAGIALGFISLPFLFRAFAHPAVGFLTLAIILITYFGQVRFRWRLPGGLVAVTAGAILARLTDVPLEPIARGQSLHLHFPLPVIADLWHSIRGGFLGEYLNIIIPMGAFNVMGSLQNIESAEAAGDRYDTKSSLQANGLGTMAAALFGSCFPTTIYIGHPGWKALGARAGYSVLNAGFMTLILLTGTVAWIAHLIPIEAGMAIVLWIGIVISAQAFQAVPRRHAPAVVIGIMVGVAAWGAFMAKAGMRSGIRVLLQGDAFNGFDWSQHAGEFTAAFLASDIKATGLFALEQGAIFTAMILSAITVYVIERRFFTAAAWCLAGAALSALGLMHSFQWGVKDVTLSFSPAWEWAIAYLLMAAAFALARFVTVPAPGIREPHTGEIPIETDP